MPRSRPALPKAAYLPNLSASVVGAYQTGSTT